MYEQERGVGAGEEEGATGSGGYGPEEIGTPQAEEEGQGSTGGKMEQETYAGGRE